MTETLPGALGLCTEGPRFCSAAADVSQACQCDWSKLPHRMSREMSCSATSLTFHPQLRMMMMMMMMKKRRKEGVFLSKAISDPI